MPNTREKLIELLDEADEWADHKCDELECETCPADKMKSNCVQQLMVDHLIANGVTVQNVAGCEYCLEDTDGFRRGFGAFSLHNPFHANEWEISTGHCKPRKIYFCPMCGRKLSEPPKGE